MAFLPRRRLHDIAGTARFRPRQGVLAFAGICFLRAAIAGEPVEEFKIVVVGGHITPIEQIGRIACHQQLQDGHRALSIGDRLL